MKITFVLPYTGLQGGVRVLAIYAERLQRRGHEVTAVSNPFTMPLRSKVKSVLVGRGWPTNPAGQSHFDRIDVPHTVLNKERPVVDADVPDADVVIATYYATAFGVQNLSRAKGAKAFFIQNHEADKRRRDADAAWRMPLHKIVISKWLLQLAQEEFGDKIVSLVPNSVDLEQFNAVERAKGAVPTVGILYSTSWMKGCRTALKALEKVAAVVPSLRVISFGAEKPGLDLRLPRYAEFHYRPPQNSLRDLYAKCDVWLCGSAREGFHLPPLEAMACRCPVVSTRVGGPLDIIEEGVNGHLVDIEDVDGLSQRLLQVLTLPQHDWKRMSDAAYDTANRFTWDDATDLFEKALELAIERDRRGDWSPRPMILA
ncbi:MAG: glycosyltransferase family 4 protein [Verrucomicrobia bacterium]|nr:glycosyltransferase family 4 protein [Verrucomicrobiota bacterium]